VAGKGTQATLVTSIRRRPILYPVAMIENTADSDTDTTTDTRASAAPVTETPAPAQALIGRRLLALFYDLWPVVALWLLISAVFTVGYTLSGHAARENIAAFSLWQWLLWLCCWLVTGAYAIISWARGGQTLGMRPWRLRVVAADGSKPTRGALVTRYLVGNLSLLLGGLGFWWAWFDREKRTWHDRASGTRVVRVAKR
jgi:uncharacterized RDD family membrane protein YckC